VPQFLTTETRGNTEIFFDLTDKGNTQGRGHFIVPVCWKCQLFSNQYKALPPWNPCGLSVAVVKLNWEKTPKTGVRGMEENSNNTVD